MSMSEARRYCQVLLETTNGVFAVSVDDSIKLDAKGRIENPQGVFTPNSVIVAVEQGVMPAGELTEHPNPFDADQRPKKVKGKGPRSGMFVVSFTPEGKAILRPTPFVAGQLT